MGSVSYIRVFAFICVDPGAGRRARGLQLVRPNGCAGRIAIRNWIVQASDPRGIADLVGPSNQERISIGD